MINKPNIDFSRVTEEDLIKGYNSNIPVNCLICSHHWTPTIANLFNDNTNCPACSHHIPWTYERFQNEKLNILDFNLDKVTKEHVNNGVKSELPIICNTCNYEFIRSIDLIFSCIPYGCTRCKNTEKWSLEKLHIKKFKRPDLNFDNVLETDINNGHKSLIMVKCIVCGDEFIRTINRIFNHYCSCLKCHVNKGPKAILFYMSNNNIIYEIEKNFVFLKYTKLLNIDIYIPNYPGIKYPICIEYDGNYPGSHFNNYKNENEKFSHSQSIIRDSIKDKYIIINNMHLLRIPYTAFASI
jgi:hypothetical protein